jgi:hypothetical protein
MVSIVEREFPVVVVFVVDDVTLGRHLPEADEDGDKHGNNPATVHGRIICRMISS